MNAVILCDGKTVYKAGVCVGTVLSLVGVACGYMAATAWDEKLKPFIEQKKKEKKERDVYGSKWDF